MYSQGSRKLVGEVEHKEYGLIISGKDHEVSRRLFFSERKVIMAYM